MTITVAPAPRPEKAPEYTHNLEDQQTILEQIDSATVRRYLAARRWRENHIADHDTTYSDPTYRQALRNLGSLRPPRPVLTETAA